MKCESGGGGVGEGEGGGGCEGMVEGGKGGGGGGGHSTDEVGLAGVGARDLHLSSEHFVILAHVQEHLPDPALSSESVLLTLVVFWL